MVFEFIFSNPNRRIEVAEVESATGRALTKRLPEVVRDLGFTNELREMFFPGVSKTAIQFTNPVTRADFRVRELRAPRLELR